MQMLSSSHTHTHARAMEYGKCNKYLSRVLLYLTNQTKNNRNQMPLEFKTNTTEGLGKYGYISTQSLLQNQRTSSEYTSRPYYKGHPEKKTRIFYAQPLSQRGCHVSMLAFQRNQFLQSFLHQKNTLLTHTKFISVIRMCLKQGTLQ